MIDARKAGSGCLNGDSVSGADDMVVLIEVDEPGFVIQQFRFTVLAIGADNDPVTYSCLVGCCTINGDDPGTGFCPDCIGGKTFSVAQIIDLDLFVFANACCIEQVAVDGAGSLIVELCMGYAGAVEFGFEHQGVHDLFR